MEAACTDGRIIRLFLLRDEDAIAKVQEKYGDRLFELAARITGSRQTGEEIVNDALLRLWNSIVPTNPNPPVNLLAVSMKTVRNLAIDRVRSERAAKRPQTVCELDEAVAAGSGGTFVAPDDIRTELLAEHINSFLRMQKAKHRCVFVMRYFSEMSVGEIGMKTGMTQNAVKSLLKRMRQNLREHLEREGYRI